MDDRAVLGVGDVGAQLQQAGDAERAGAVDRDVDGGGGAGHRLLAVAAMAGRTARARMPPVRARTG
ncbi:hypothetical protein [Streptomyces vastus]|uniref:hypothetical protein n=1 Tax=Streptomyces vastus TaxID=285451 RepID=UPI0031D5C821